MKKIICAALAMLLLCGCAGKSGAETTGVPATVPTAAPTTVPPTQPPTEIFTEPPTEAPTEEPTEAPTEPPVPVNPLNGQALEEPYNGRPFGVVINNVPGAVPLYGVSKADLFFEMFVNDLCTRGLAIYSDVSQVKSVGSVRSLRYNFTNLCQMYDAIVAHCGASSQVMTDLGASGVPNVNVGNEGFHYFYRDEERLSAGYAWEHCLFVRGAEMATFAENKGLRMNQEGQRDYGLLFREDGTPEGGEDASYINIAMKHRHATKNTIMKYQAEVGKYLFNQYTMDMYDPSENAPIYFENVIVMFCEVYDDGVYHVARLEGSGEGYFACGGKLIPILWSIEGTNGPIRFTHLDGTPLELGVGSSYIALAPLVSDISWE